jgi:hypothetical protein
MSTGRIIPTSSCATNNIGQVLHDRGDLEEALHYVQRALAIGEKVYGWDHLDVATWANNIGMFSA